MDKQKRYSQKCDQESPCKSNETSNVDHTSIVKENSQSNNDLIGTGSGGDKKGQSSLTTDHMQNGRNRHEKIKNSGRVIHSDNSVRNRNRTKHSTVNKSNDFYNNNTNFNKRAVHVPHKDRKKESFKSEPPKKNSCDFLTSENLDSSRKNSCDRNENITLETSNEVTVLSPASSKLNPNALSFSPQDQERKNTIDVVESVGDISTSPKSKTLETELKSTKHDTDDNLNLPLQEQGGTGTIKKNISSNASNQKKHKNVDHHQKYERKEVDEYSSGVISCGSTLHDQSNSVNVGISQSRKTNSSTCSQTSVSSGGNSYNQSNNENLRISQNKITDDSKGFHSPSSFGESRSSIGDEPHKQSDSANCWLSSNGNNRRSQRRSSIENQSFGQRLQRSIKDKFQDLADSGDKDVTELINYVFSPKACHIEKVIEVDKDLFTVGEDYHLAHCVAEDMNMGSGIAVEFRRKFKNVPQLLNFREKSGGLAVLEVKSRYIYYMVTKKTSSSKPTYQSFWKSLKKLRNHMKENDAKKLAIPRIGCGLDRLDWNIVKILLEFLFRNLDVHILVCNFQQDEPNMNSPNIQRSRRCKIVHEVYPITKIENGTIIVYFASSDGQSTSIMAELDEKFQFLGHFRQSSKKLGDVIRFEDRKKNYILCGCIVKEDVGDLFDFVSLGKCLASIQKSNKNDGFYYVGFQKVDDDNDKILNEKILNCMSHTLWDVEIYCCGSRSVTDPSLNDSQRSS